MTEQTPRPSHDETGANAEVKAAVLELMRSTDLKKKIQDLEAQDEVWLIAAVCAEAAATHIGLMQSDLQQRIDQSFINQSTDAIKAAVGDEVQKRINLKIQTIAQEAIQQGIADEFQQLKEVLSKSLHHAAERIGKSIQLPDVDTDIIARAVKHSVEATLGDIEQVPKQLSNLSSAINAAIERSAEQAAARAAERAAEQATGKLKSLRESLGFILAGGAVVCAAAGYAAGAAIERGNTLSEMVKLQQQAQASQSPSQQAAGGKETKR